MGIADIFEALTAKDRPYKKGKTLSESLDDPRQVQARTATSIRTCSTSSCARRSTCATREQFLDPEQIDEVDLSKIPGIPEDLLA